MVLVDAILLQTIVAAARGGVVERLPKIVATEEPVECQMRLFAPIAIFDCVEGFDRSRHHRVRLDRLLVILGDRLTSATKAITADRAKPPPRRLLLFCQPPQGTKPNLGGAFVAAPSSAQNQRVRQLGVVVRRHVLEPGPIVGCRVLIQIDQLVGQRVAHLVDQPISAEPAEVFVNSNQRQRPSAR